MDVVWQAWYEYGEEDIGVYSTLEKAVDALSKHCKYNHENMARRSYNPLAHTYAWPNLNNSFCGVERIEVQ